MMKTKITLKLVYETTLEDDLTSEEIKDTEDDMMDEIFEDIGSGNFAYTETLVDVDGKKTSLMEDSGGKKISVEKQLESLSDELIEAAYRKKELDYRTQDFLEHAEEYEPDHILSEEDARALAKEFIMYVQDCNIPENEQIDGMLDDYFDEN